MDHETTIVAVSSPTGRSTHALIRATGPHAWLGTKQLGLEFEPRRIIASRISFKSEEIPVLISAFPANSSFTGQETIEIQVVNNPFVVDFVMNELINATNGRFAEAGEFTARSFLNGNISISAAEGVCATISAGNDAELLGATLLRKGALANATEPISLEIIRVLALVEAGIDFTDEEEVVAISKDDLRTSVEHCIHLLNAILENKISMAALCALPSVVIAGKPNAGKSTLFNSLIEKQRVVISSIAGTTRDVITEQVRFNGKDALLTDIAGLEFANGELNEAMQIAAQRSIDSADVVLWCVAPGEATECSLENAIIVHTMKDKNNSHNDAINAQTGEGLIMVQAKVSNVLIRTQTPKLDALALLPRHESCLENTLVALKETLSQIITPELASASLREALNSIGSITGHVTPDEIIGEVFSTFCIGK